MGYVSTPPQISPFPLLTTAAPGSGSFTPTILTRGIARLGQLRVGGCFLFRFDDGADWEVRWGFYTGSVVTRPTNGFVASSTGSALTLTVNAIATALSPLGLWSRGMGETAMSIVPATSTATLVSSGLGTATVTGTAAAGTFADTNQLTRQNKTQLTSATTASASNEVKPSAACVSRNTGYHFCSRLGVTQLPNAPRMWVGTGGGVISNEPSAFVDTLGFGKDSTDTNIQMMVNDNSGTATKQDTSIVLAINTLYEVSVWCDAAGATGYGLLVDYTNQALWYGSAASNLPTIGTFVFARSVVSLNGTDTGTAAIMQFCGMYLRTGA